MAWKTLPVKSLHMDGKGIKRLADEHNVRSFWIFGLDCKLVWVCNVSVWTAVAGEVLVLVVVLVLVLLLPLVVLLLDDVVDGGFSDDSGGGKAGNSDLCCVVNHFPKHSVEQYSFPTSLFSTTPPVFRSFLHQSHLRAEVS